jgi:hypothetical protein
LRRDLYKLIDPKLLASLKDLRALPVTLNLIVKRSATPAMVKKSASS